MIMSVPYKTYLEESQLPKAGDNLRADMKTDHRPILNPATLQPVTVDDLSHVFCTKLAEQELNNTDRYIEIPGPVRDFYRMYRPSPLVRRVFPGAGARYARQDLLQIRGRQHQRQSQAEFRHRPGVLRKGAGPQRRHHGNRRGPVGHGASPWLAASLGLDLRVYMVKVFRPAEAVPQGGDAKRMAPSVIASPSDTTEVGRKMLAQDSRIAPGSLGTRDL